MKVENKVMPSPEQARATFLAPEDGPIVMVNLLKFKEKATYGSGEAVTGREAYMRYGARMRGLVEKSGGRFIFTGDVVRLMLGEVEDLWDAVGIVEYPSRAAFRAITQSPEFHEIELHRIAGLAGQLNIETKQR
jgi:uncharacterized protein (DUF1330 family)